MDGVLCASLINSIINHLLPPLWLNASTWVSGLDRSPEVEETAGRPPAQSWGRGDGVVVVVVLVFGAGGKREWGCGFWDVNALCLSALKCTQLGALASSPACSTINSLASNFQAHFFS